MLPSDVIANVRRIEIRTRRIVDELTGGAYHSVFKGRGMEFEEVREYFPGDDVRAIDWNVTARFGRPFIKKFVEERELTVVLLVDVSASGDFGSGQRSKNEQAAELAALLAFSAIRNQDQVALQLFSCGSELHLPARKGRRHVLRLVSELLTYQRQHRGTDIGGALEKLMRTMPRRAIVFLISDMLDRRNFLPQLRIAAKKHDIVALRMLDPHECQLPETGYLWIEDSETDQLGCFAGASGTAVAAHTRAGAAARTAQQQMFNRAGIDMLDIVCGQDYVRPLMQYFRAREKRR